jgi:DNA-binding MurR/RpiR family transcriptional regulator
MSTLDVPDLIDRLLARLDEMSPELRKAARFVAERPMEVGVGSIRKIADAAGVKPNTLVRLAQMQGYQTFEAFRGPFRAQLTTERLSFPDRARWLRSIARSGQFGPLYGEMATTSIENLEGLFQSTSADQVKAAADAIIGSRTTYVLGVGLAYSLAHLFAYLARMAIDQVVAVPRDGSLPVDDIAKAGPGDVLVAMTFEPYRVEVVDAVRVAAAQGVTVIGISDRRTSPVVRASQHAFVLPTDTPQAFTSVVAVSAFLETLMAFVIAEAGDDAVRSIEAFDARRRKLGVYVAE